MTFLFMGPQTTTKFAVNGFFGSLQHELAMQHSNVSVTTSTLCLTNTVRLVGQPFLTTAMSYHHYCCVLDFSACLLLLSSEGISPCYSEAALYLSRAGATHQKESFDPTYTSSCDYSETGSPFSGTWSFKTPTHTEGTTEERRQVLSTVHYSCWSPLRV